MIIRGYNVGQLLKATGREVLADRVPVLAGSAAYSMFFSLFPLLLFLTPLLSLTGNRERTASFVLAQLVTVLPAQQLEAVRPVLEGIIYSDAAPSLMSIGLILAAWSGSNIFGNLMGALNVAFDIEETRPWWHQQLIRLASFVGGAIVVILGSTVFLMGEDVTRWLSEWRFIPSAIAPAIGYLQFPVAFLLLVGLAFLTYWALPNVRPSKSHLLVASVATTILWVAATLLFRIYVQRFPPNPAYGFIGGVIILLTWMYYSMFVVLVGGELAAELNRGTGAIVPRGGAIYLGRVVSDRGPIPSTQRIEGREMLEQEPEPFPRQL